MNIIIGLVTTFLAIFLSFIILYKYTENYIHTTHFACPYCRSTFKLSRVNFALALKTGISNERIVTCPACGYRGKMPILED